MTESDQAHLDADVASLGQITARIETELANLKQTEAASGLDFTGLDAALDALRSAAPSAPSPEPAPAPVAQAEPEQPTEPAADVPPAQ